MKAIRIPFVLLAVCLLAACSLPWQPPAPGLTEPAASLTPTPLSSFRNEIPTITPTGTTCLPASGGGEMALIAYLRGPDGLGSGPFSIGEDVEVILESDPVLRSISDHGVDQVAWSQPPEIEMQVCFAMDAPCTLSGEWLPFTTSAETVFVGGGRVTQRLPVDWLGERTLWIVAQFRTADHRVIPAFSSIDSARQAQPTIQLETMIGGIWDAGTPLAEMPAPIQTGVAATRAALGVTQTAYPVEGSVDVAPGVSAVGSTAGDTIDVTVVFSATSAFGAVTEMRISGGMCSPDTLQSAPWEPYAPMKTYPVYVALNWTTFAISVQYRDEKGNLSQVFCDQTGVEGMPPASTSSA